MDTSSQCVLPSVKSTITLSAQFNEAIDGLVDNSAMKAVNKVPGSRKIMPFLCFMVNFDELWLYQYH